MNTKDLHDLSVLYALGALQPKESRAFAEHLPGCDRCRREIAEVRAAGIGIDDIDRAHDLDDRGGPPPEMRAKVLDQLSEVPQIKPMVQKPAPKTEPLGSTSDPKRRPLPQLLAAAAALLLVLGGGFWLLNRSSSDSVSEVAQEIREADDVVELNVSRTADAPGALTLLIDVEGGRTLVSADGLAEVGPDETYQLWLIDGDEITPSELFRPEVGSTGSSAELVLDAVPSAVVGVTIEPAGGSPAPTGEVLYAGSLPG